MWIVRSFAIIAVARAPRAICNNDDIYMLGGSGDVVIDRVEKCLPDVIWENNMSQVEECIDTAFKLDIISSSCKDCFAKFSDKNELELKTCVFKCNGPAKTSGICHKCKEQVAMQWDRACFKPEEGNRGGRSEKRDKQFQGEKMGTTRVGQSLILMSLPIITILSY